MNILRANVLFRRVLLSSLIAFVACSVDAGTWKLTATGQTTKTSSSGTTHLVDSLVDGVCDGGAGHFSGNGIGLAFDDIKSQRYSSVSMSLTSSVKARITWYPANACDKPPKRIRVYERQLVDTYAMVYGPKQGYTSGHFRRSSSLHVSSQTHMYFLPGDTGEWYFADNFDENGGWMAYEIELNGKTSVDLPSRYLTGSSSGTMPDSGTDKLADSVHAYSQYFYTIMVENLEFMVNPPAVKGLKVDEKKITALTVDTNDLPNGVAGVEYQAKLKSKAKGSVKLTWTNNSCYTYIIRRRKAGETAIDQTLFAGSSPFVDDGVNHEGLPIDTNYEYTIAAYDGFNHLEGSESLAVPARIKLDPKDVMWLVVANVPSSGQAFPDAFRWKGSSTFVGTPYLPGDHVLEFTVADAFGHVDSKNLAIHVTAATQLAVTNTSLPAAALGQPYSVQVAASGGIAPYVWSCPAGRLPEGLRLSREGLIFGVPSQEALHTTSFDLQVRDAAGNVATATFGNPIDIEIGLTGEERPDPFATSGWVGIASDLEYLDVPLVRHFDRSMPTRTYLASLKPEAAWNVLALQGGPHLHKPVKASFLMPEQHLLSAWDHLKLNRGGIIARTSAGPAAWFKLSGDPHIGARVPTSKDYHIEALVEINPNRLLYISSTDSAYKTSFMQANPEAIDLDAVFTARHAEFEAAARAELENLATIHKPNISAQNRAKFIAERLASKTKRKLWEWLTEHATTAPGKQIKIHVHDSTLSCESIAGGGTKFKNGEMLACASEAAMKVSGGMRGFIRVLSKAGLVVEADAVFKTAVIQNAVRTAGGAEELPVAMRVLKITPKGVKALKCIGVVGLLIGIVDGGYEIYYAKDKVKAAVQVVSGNALGWGATVVAAKVASPLLAFGPLGWLGYGLVVVGSGALGYYVGHEGSGLIYDFLMRKSTGNMAREMTGG